MVTLAIVLTLALGQSPSSPFPVKPSDTDPAIVAFDAPHLVYFSEKIPKRNELLIFLPGTNGKPGGTNLFCQTAADLGYDVLAMAYPTDVPATKVRKREDPEAFEKFRSEIIEGKDLSPDIEVDRTNSIENRLVKALQFLQRTHPSENWKQYLTEDGQPNWPRIAVSGHSQGGGHAWLLGIKHRVARVVATGAPKDFDRERNRPAAWYRKPATPLSAFFAFNHELDKQGCDYEEQLQNLRAFGLDKLGPATRVDNEKPPFAHSHMLFTNFAGSPTESSAAHSSVIGDRGTPKGKDGVPVFKAVWIYMLTEPVGEK